MKVKTYINNHFQRSFAVVTALVALISVAPPTGVWIETLNGLMVGMAPGHWCRNSHLDWIFRFHGIITELLNGFAAGPPGGEEIASEKRGTRGEGAFKTFGIW